MSKNYIGGVGMDKQVVVNFVNRNCTRSACLMCNEGDKYESYEDCPFLSLKQITRDRNITINDVSDELVQKLNRK